MNKIIFTTILMFVTFKLFCQNVIETRPTLETTIETSYPVNSEIKIFDMGSLNNKLHSKKNLAGVFVNGIFVGNQSVLNVINSDKIESVNIEEVNFEKNEKEYYKKILIKMKPGYIPKFTTLNQLITKYLDLDENPIVFQINENIINHDYDEYLVDEKNIQSIITNKIKTSKIKTEVNLIKLMTKN